MAVEKLVIRPMVAADVDAFPAAFAAQGWTKPRRQYVAYFAAQRAGALQVLVAELDGEAAGYLLLKPEAEAGPFSGQHVPEIADFNVLMRFQRRGIGTRLLEEAERLAGDRVSLGVGLHAGYGAAQRLYSRRGYVPDGSGVWYRDHPLAPYAPCENDDDLVLYMVKACGPQKSSPGG